MSEDDLIAAYSDGSEQDTVNVTKDVPQSLSGVFTPFVTICHTMYVIIMIYPYRSKTQLSYYD